MDRGEVDDITKKFERMMRFIKKIFFIFLIYFLKEIAHNQAIECARAIGLDEDYLKKIEEQQRLRDEILRKKTQKRKEKEAAIKGMEILNRKNSKMDGVSKGFFSIFINFWIALLTN